MKGELNAFTSGEVGKAPWDTERPKEIVIFRRCIYFDVRLQEIEEILCDTELNSVCERPCNDEIDSPFQVNTCVGGRQMFFNPELKSFDDANTACASLGSAASLAIPSSSRVRGALGFPFNFAATSFYVGLRSLVERFPPLTADFVTIDNELNHYTSGTIGENPWEPNEPSTADGTNFCVARLNVNRGHLEAVSCEGPLTSVCERYCGDNTGFIFDECVEDVQYYFNPKLRNFDAAEADCRSFGGTLAIPTDESSFLNFTRFYHLHKTSNNIAYVGLREFNVESLETADFLTLKGEVNNFTSGNFGEFPWLQGEPNSFEGSLEICVAISPIEEGLFDTECDLPAFPICQRRCPEANAFDINNEDDTFTVTVIVASTIAVLGLILTILTIAILKQRKSQVQIEGTDQEIKELKTAAEY